MPSPVPRTRLQLSQFTFECFLLLHCFTDTIFFSLENSLYVNLDTKEFVCSMPIMYCYVDAVLQFGMQRPYG